MVNALTQAASFFDDEDHPQDQEEESFFTLPTPPRRRAPSPAGTLDGFDGVDDLPPPLRFGHQGRSPPPLRRRDETPAGGEPDPGLPGADIADDDEALISRLLRRWMDERAAPEVLPHCEDDIAQCLFLLHEQTSALAEIRADQSDIDQSDHLRYTLVQQEMERVKWLVKSIVRCRIAKVVRIDVADAYQIERYSQHLLRTASARAALTQTEDAYLTRYQALLEKHLHTSVLDSLPQSLANLTSPASMIVTPDLNTAVAVSVRRRCDAVRLPDGDVLDLELGSKHILRYRTIRTLLRAGDVRLL